jgi:hypothetical protein
MAGQTDLRTNRRLDRQIELTNRGLNIQTAGQTDGWTDRWLGIQIAGQTDGGVDRWVNKQTADHMDIWTDLRGWTDRWLVRQT